MQGGEASLITCYSSVFPEQPKRTHGGDLSFYPALGMTGVYKPEELVPC
jgi:hypothetical protein